MNDEARIVIAEHCIESLKPLALALEEMLSLFSAVDTKYLLEFYAFISGLF